MDTVFRATIKMVCCSCIIDHTVLPPWSVTTDAPNEVKFHKELQPLKRQISPIPDDLLPALFSDYEDLLFIKQFFANVW